MHTARGRGVRSRAGLRALADQVVVITGGSSGIGRATAIRMGRAGARVVVMSRDEQGLAETVAEIVRNGGEAKHIVCDVTDRLALQSAVDRVEKWFGRVDTWVGNAGVLMYGRFTDTSPDEFRRMMEVNYIGQIHGIQVALPALHRAGGGALICVTSAEAVVTLPMHSAYAASKHALEGALDGLRRELIDAKEPIQVTAVRPAVIDTAIYSHARNVMRRRPKAPRPYYGPDVVADAVLFAAEHPVRTIHAGGGARLFTLLQMLFPSALDAGLGRFGVGMMHTGEPTPPNEGNLERSMGAAAGGLPARGRRWSLHTWLAVHPNVQRTTILGAAGLGILTFRARRRT
ncbi:SDR family oxidoreductase [Microbacterium sp.]|uniref:SDR family oxidoreductase n=1 Tax=Microbacterium sp. TaxID=51671 RepID=UPI0028112C9D|nr:SDR family oxidoreductase [Microbacterium sp.]